jgi:hypothetical protein
MLAGNIIRALRRDPHRASELYQLYAGSFPRVDLPAGIIDPGRILELVSKDSFGIEHEFEVGLRDPMQDVGLWIFPSFVNHSCVENARRIFYGDVMMVRALRDLLAGEEILINYFAFGGDNRLSIGAIWQINCQCPMCQERNRTPQQVAERRESLLDRIIRGSQESRRSSDVETLVRSMEETYSPEDQFREDMAFPLLILMQAYVNDGITEQAIATGRQVLGLSLGLPAGFLVLAHILIARMYTETKRPDLAKAELRTMKDMVWKRARITLSQLTIVANKLIESHDPNGVLMEALRHLEEEESALPP